MWPRSWRLGLEAVSRRSRASARSRLGVGTPRPSLGLELWRPWSRSHLGLNCQRLGLGLGLWFQGLGLASVSTKKASCTSLLLSDKSENTELTDWLTKFCNHRNVVAGYNAASCCRFRSSSSSSSGRDVLRRTRWKQCWQHAQHALQIAHSLSHLPANLLAKLGCWKNGPSKKRFAN